METMPALTETEKRLLMSAAVWGFGPKADHGPTVKVLGLAMRLELASESNTSSTDPRPEDWEVRVEKMYHALQLMVRTYRTKGPHREPARPGPALFEGSGNWGVPGEPTQPACDPLFNACRLTAKGLKIANGLLDQHPEYRDTNVA